MKRNGIPSSIIKAINELLAPYNESINGLLEEANQKNGQDKLYLTIKEIEEQYSISRSSITRRIQSGALKAVKLADSKSGRLLIERKSLQALLDKCRCN